MSPWAFFYKLNLTNIKTIKKFGKVPIGKPFKGVNYSFNNSNELIIEGNVVAKGYLNNTEETKKIFIKKKQKIQYR